MTEGNKENINLSLNFTLPPSISQPVPQLSPSKSKFPPPSFIKNLHHADFDSTWSRVDNNKFDKQQRRKSAFPLTTSVRSILSSRDDEKAKRKEERRKSLANRRVSFATEATVHTWDVIEYIRDIQPKLNPDCKPNPPKPEQPDFSVIDSASTSTCSPAPRNNLVYSTSPSNDGSLEDQDNDLTDTAMSLVSLASDSTDSSAVLNLALQQAADRAGTRGIEYDEYGEGCVPMELVEDEVTNAFQPLVSNIPTIHPKSSLDEQDLDQSDDSMELTMPLGGIKTPNARPVFLDSKPVTSADNSDVNSFHNRHLPTPSPEPSTEKHTICSTIPTPNPRFTAQPLASLKVMTMTGSPLRKSPIKDAIAVALKSVSPITPQSPKLEKLCCDLRSKRTPDKALNRRVSSFAPKNQFVSPEMGRKLSFQELEYNPYGETHKDAANQKSESLMQEDSAPLQAWEFVRAVVSKACITPLSSLYTTSVNGDTEDDRVRNMEARILENQPALFQLYAEGDRKTQLELSNFIRMLTSLCDGIEWENCRRQLLKKLVKELHEGDEEHEPYNSEKNQTCQARIEKPKPPASPTPPISNSEELVKQAVESDSESELSCTPGNLNEEVTEASQNISQWLQECEAMIAGEPNWRIKQIEQDKATCCVILQYDFEISLSIILEESRIEIPEIDTLQYSVEERCPLEIDGFAGVRQRQNFVKHFFLKFLQRHISNWTSKERGLWPIVSFLGTSWTAGQTLAEVARRLHLRYVTFEVCERDDMITIASDVIIRRKNGEVACKVRVELEWEIGIDEGEEEIGLAINTRVRAVPQEYTEEGRLNEDELTRFVENRMRSGDVEQDIEGVLYWPEAVLELREWLETII